MEKKGCRFPLHSLENQYTFLNKHSKNNHGLQELSLELSNMTHSKKLPTISKKYLQTAKKMNVELTSIQRILNNRKLTNQTNNYQCIWSNQSMLPMSAPFLMPQNTQVPYCAAHPFLQSLPNPMENPAQHQALLSTNEHTGKQPKSYKLGQQSKKQQVTKNIKQIIKFPQKSQINRFRVIGYVVYFSIFFKYYSKKFTELRRNWFNQRYSINEGIILLQSSAKILKYLHEIDVFKMMATAKQRAKDKDSLENRNYRPHKTSNQILTLIHFMTLLMEYISEFMTSPKFMEQHHEVFTVGILNQNFMISNLYLPQEAALLHIHPKGYIQIEQQTEIVLLMVKLVIKIVVFNYLLGLRYSRHWNAKQEQSHNLDKNDIEDIWKMSRFAALFLCITCEEISDKCINTAHPLLPLNFQEMANKFHILPAKVLEDVQKPGQQAPNSNDGQSRFIKNLEGYADMRTIISGNSVLRSFKQKIKMKIIDLLTAIYASLKIEEAKVYDFIWLTTLDEKYIILKGIQEEVANRKREKQKHKQKINKEKNKNNVVTFYGETRGTLQPIHEDDNESNEGTNTLLKDNTTVISEDSSQSNEAEGEGKEERRKKMRFKHEQMFYDYKYMGHNKLTKLKEQMGKK